MGLEYKSLCLFDGNLAVISKYDKGRVIWLLVLHSVENSMYTVVSEGEDVD